MTENTDFSKFLNKEGTGIRPDLQVDFSTFEKDYLAANPDVAQAVGNVPGAGLRHYFDYGKAEGRPGAAPALQGLSQLDYQALTANPNDPVNSVIYLNLSFSLETYSKKNSSFFGTM